MSASRRSGRPGRELLIRPATAADLAALCLLRDSQAAHEAKLAAAATGAVRFLAAVIDTELVGFASLFLANPVVGPSKSHLPKLSDCLVAPDCRSQGVGRALVNARENLARTEGHERVYVSVDPVENPRWCNFFRGRGYTMLQPEPYRKRELRHWKDGTYEVHAWRRDLMLNLLAGTRDDAQ